MTLGCVLQLAPVAAMAAPNGKMITCTAPGLSKVTFQVKKDAQGAYRMTNAGMFVEEIRDTAGNSGTYPIFKDEIKSFTFSLFGAHKHIQLKGRAKIGDCDAIFPMIEIDMDKEVAHERVVTLQGKLTTGDVDKNGEPFNQRSSETATCTFIPVTL